jgi:hypothetical protein
MIYLTQLVYVHPGKEDVFHQFEDVAIPLIAKHNGELVLRLRPNAESVVVSAIEVPYEVHVVRFHMRCKPQRPCRICGRGTQSVSGICGAIGECRTAQHTGYVRFANAAKRASPQATDTDLDTLVDELLG